MVNYCVFELSSQQAYLSQPLSFIFLVIKSEQVWKTHTLYNQLHYTKMKIPKDLINLIVEYSLTIPIIHNVTCRGLIAILEYLKHRSQCACGLNNGQHHCKWERVWVSKYPTISLLNIKKSANIMGINSLCQLIEEEDNLMVPSLIGIVGQAEMQHIQNRCRGNKSCEKNCYYV